MVRPPWLQDGVEFFFCPAFNGKQLLLAEHNAALVERREPVSRRWQLHGAAADRVFVEVREDRLTAGGAPYPVTERVTEPFRYSLPWK